MALTNGAARLPRSARRAQLLAAAQEVFVAQGYHAAAMDDIADRAGVSKPVLYQHFPGKLELYLALLDTHIAALVDSVRAAMSRTSDNKERVHNAVETYFDFVGGEGEAFRLVFESDLRNDPSVRERVDRAIGQCVDAITQTIAGDTHLDPIRARLLSVGLTGIAETSARWWLQHRDQLAKAEAVELMAALAWRGISAVPRFEGSSDGRRTDPSQVD